MGGGSVHADLHLDAERARTCAHEGQQHDGEHRLGRHGHEGACGAGRGGAQDQERVTLGWVLLACFVFVSGRRLQRYAAQGGIGGAVSASAASAARVMINAT
jgi:hypothetical protein